MVAEITDSDLIADNDLISEDLSPFVTVEHGMRGYFAVLMWWNAEGSGFWEPWQSGFGSYKTSEGAWREARDWARSEEIEARR